MQRFKLSITKTKAGNVFYTPQHRNRAIEWFINYLESKNVVDYSYLTYSTPELPGYDIRDVQQKGKDMLVLTVEYF